MKLNIEELAFIDRYLKNSEIEFIDVRMELVDHVANAVEERMNENGQSFYDAFKAYMVQHKRDLLHGQERLRKKLHKSSFKQILKLMTKPYMVALCALMFLVLTFFKAVFSFPFPYISFILGVVLSSGLLYALSMLPHKKYRFSGLEALAWMMFLPMQVVSLLFNMINYKPMVFEQFSILANVLVALFTCFYAAFLLCFFKQRRGYQLKFGKT